MSRMRQGRSRRGAERTLGWAAAGALVLCTAGNARAERECGGRWEVEAGDSLWSIARECDISVRALRNANGLSEEDELRPGRTLRVPASRSGGGGSGGGSSRGGSDEADEEDRPSVVELRRGQTLSELAREHGCTVEALQEANGIEDPDAVQVGQEVRIPGRGAGRSSAGRESGGASTAITMVRVTTGERITVRLFDARGRVRSSARRQVTRLMRHPTNGYQANVAVGLLELLQKVADRWPGRVFQVQSGARPPSRRSGKKPGNHTLGRAMDFSVEGVSHRELRDFCRTLPNAGVGYYPNSTFVHLDTRDRPAYWVDLSGPGEPARYVDPEDAEEAEAGGEPGEGEGEEHPTTDAAPPVPPEPAEDGSDGGEAAEPAGEEPPPPPRGAGAAVPETAPAP